MSLKGLKTPTRTWIAGLPNFERLATTLSMWMRVSLEWAGHAPLGEAAVGRDDAGPLPTAALEGLMAASARPMI